MIDSHQGNAQRHCYNDDLFSPVRDFTLQNDEKKAANNYHNREAQSQNQNLTSDGHDIFSVDLTKFASKKFVLSTLNYQNIKGEIDQLNKVIFFSFLKI